jgi:hypothetical protein
MPGVTGSSPVSSTIAIIEPGAPTALRFLRVWTGR